MLHPGVFLGPAAGGCCRLGLRAGPSVEAMMQESPHLTAAHLELLADAELGLTSENPSRAVQLWIFEDYRFEGADVYVLKHVVISFICLCCSVYHYWVLTEKMAEKTADRNLLLQSNICLPDSRGSVIPAHVVFIL